MLQDPRRPLRDGQTQTEAAVAAGPGLFEPLEFIVITPPPSIDSPCDVACHLTVVLPSSEGQFISQFISQCMELLCYTLLSNP